MIKHSLPFALATILATAAHAECNHTAEQPKLPDGTQASTEEMLAGKKAVDKYIEETKQFLACLAEEEKSGVEAGTETEESRKARLERYNGAVDDMQGIAQGFNAEIKNYKARNQAEKAEKSEKSESEKSE